jgi:hypothetical protein
MGRSHDFVETTGHDGATLLRQDPPDLLGGGLPLGPAPHDCDLTRHRW